jgi:hypothetical protein
MSQADDLEFMEAMVTEMLKLSLRANLRSLVYLLGMAKVAAIEARRSQSADGDDPIAPAQPA